MAPKFKSIDNLLHSEGIFSPDGKGKLSKTKKIYKQWYSVNGDVEQKHTTGLYLAEPSGYDKYPTLIVYVDKPLFVQEFRTMKHIYLTRLEIDGLKLKDIQFTLSKDEYVKPKEYEGLKKAEVPELPELNSEEIELIEWQTKDMPENLKDTVSKAMSLSMRKQKFLDTQKSQNSS